MMAAWDEEYERSGIPSSFRDDPSGVVLWLLDNWTRLEGAKSFPERGIDIGCGTARNAVHLAKRGVEMTGVDLSEVAIEAGRHRAHEAGVSLNLAVHDLTLGLPVGDSEVDVALDIFVYKHQVDPAVRRSYREELSRALVPQGRLLVSLAEPGDGYYSSCPPLEGHGGPHAVLDPVAGVGSVLFSLEELVEEMSDCFALEMAWRKAKQGMMHGEIHMRHTLATIWRRPISE